MKVSAIEQNIIKNYGKLHEYMGSPLVKKAPIGLGDWQINQFGNINYKDKVQLSVHENKVKIDKKPLFWPRAAIMKNANAALDLLNRGYERRASR